MAKDMIEQLFKVTEVELIYHNKVKAKDRLSISNSEDGYKILRRVWDINRIELVEESKMLLLDRSNALIGVSNLSIGGMSECVLDQRIILATALKARAPRFIIAHNHITGNLKPSAADKFLTENLRQAAKLLRVELTDHIIVARNDYFSFADEKLLPK